MYNMADRPHGQILQPTHTFLVHFVVSRVQGDGCRLVSGISVVIWELVDEAVDGV